MIMSSITNGNILMSNYVDDAALIKIILEFVNDAF